MKGKTIMFLFFSQIPPELKSRFVLTDVDLICWGLIKVKILQKFSRMKFSSRELKLSGFAVKPQPMKELKLKLKHIELYNVVMMAYQLLFVSSAHYLLLSISFE